MGGVEAPQKGSSLGTSTPDHQHCASPCQWLP